MDHDLIKTIARVRRAMPRNVDVMAICDALERLSEAKPASTLTASSQAKASRAQFDRTAYQRDYMRKRRARKTDHDTPSR